MTLLENASGRVNVSGNAAIGSDKMRFSCLNSSENALSQTQFVFKTAFKPAVVGKIEQRVNRLMALTNLSANYIRKRIFITDARKERPAGILGRIAFLERQWQYNLISKLHSASNWRNLFENRNLIRKGNVFSKQNQMV